MKIKINNIIIKFMIFIIVIVPAIIFENMSSERLNLFIILIFAYSLLNFTRIFSKRVRSYDSLFLVVELIILLTFEMNSRYYINYLFHSLYLLTIIDASINLKARYALITNLIILSASAYKYIKLLKVSMTFNTLSELIFFMILSSLIAFSIIMLRYYKIEKEKKEELIKELNIAHEKLIMSSKLDTQLKLSKQRNSIARDIHDTLGHTMTAAIMQMEVLELRLDSDKENSRDSLRSIKEKLRDGLSQVRGVVEAFASFDVSDIEKLITDFSKDACIKVNLEIDIQRSSEEILASIYRASQESLTNSKRHGKATEAIIKILEKDDGIRFYYKDNGEVDPNWEIGFGLKAMRDRFLDHNGYIEFLGEDGFEIDGFISWEEAND